MSKFSFTTDLTTEGHDEVILNSRINNFVQKVSKEIGKTSVIDNNAGTKGVSVCKDFIGTISVSKTYDVDSFTNALKKCISESELSEHNAKLRNVTI